MRKSNTHQAPAQSTVRLTGLDQSDQPDLFSYVAGFSHEDSWRRLQLRKDSSTERAYRVCGGTPCWCLCDW